MRNKYCGKCACWDNGKCSQFVGFYPKDSLLANNCKYYKGGITNIVVKSSRKVVRGTKKLKEKLRGVKNVKENR